MHAANLDFLKVLGSTLQKKGNGEYGMNSTLKSKFNHKNVGLKKHELERTIVIILFHYTNLNNILSLQEQ